MAFAGDGSTTVERSAAMSIYLKTPRVLWGAMLTASLLFCGASCIPLAPYFKSDPVPFIIAPCMCMVALVDAVMSFVFPRMQFAGWCKRNLADKVTSERDPNADVMFRTAAPEIKVLRLDRARIRSVIAVWQTAFVIASALSESVALIGATLSILGFWPAWSAPIGFAGFVLLLLRWPSEKAVLGPIERAVGARVLLGDVSVRG
ncbi:MAG: hypothetical protein HY898_25830 [Deltaproteobacteria bacterium]|nr:hypothetical protein [Deltaproteobacteria bacterium]